MWKEQNFLANFRGNFCRLFHFYGKLCLNLVFYENLYRLLVKNDGKAKEYLAGTIMAAGATTLLHPFQVAEVRLATEMKKEFFDRTYKDVRQSLRVSNVENGGFPKGMFKGVSFSVFSVGLIGLANGLANFGLQNMQMPFKVPTECTLLGVSLILYPLDTIRRRLQNTDSKKPYNNLLTCLKHSIKVGGISSFYNGFLVCALRNAIAFGVFTEIRKII